MTVNPLPNVYGELLVTRPPVPVTCNKAGANYKSEVPHLEYSPREAYREWLAICDGIIACGGDALFAFEPADDPFLDIPALHINGDGDISPQGSKEVLGNLDAIETGRVFTANGPWVTVANPTASVFQLTGLTSGQRVWVRVRGIGTQGAGPWSDPYTKIVP